MSSAVHVSTIVRGRRNVGTRVQYRVDPQGETEDWAVPETVVLRRWRCRFAAGRTFCGGRLSPTLWRALPLALGDAVHAWGTLTAAEIEERIDAARSALTARHFRLPDATIVHALVAYCGPCRLVQLVERHADPARWKSPGVPDLFLFAREHSGRVTASRFVEVKRPDEKMTRGQPGELAFLQSLGLEARVLRLIERPLAAHR